MSLLIEPFGEWVDDLTRDDDDVDEHGGGSMGLHDDLRRSRGDFIEADYAWALSEDYHRPPAQALFWYVSAEKLRPRLGQRDDEEGRSNWSSLWRSGETSLGLYERLAQGAGWRFDWSARCEARTFAMWFAASQISSRYPYAEIRDNLIHKSMRPIDLLRCKLSFIGASQFDPRSDRWLRFALSRECRSLMNSPRFRIRWTRRHDERGCLLFIQ